MGGMKASGLFGPLSFCAGNGDPTSWSPFVVCREWGPNKLVPIRCMQGIGTKQAGPHSLHAGNGDQTSWSPFVVCREWGPNKLVPICCMQGMGTQQVGPHSLCAGNEDPTSWSPLLCAGNGNPTSWSQFVVRREWGPKKLIPIRCVQGMGTHQVGPHTLCAGNGFEKNNIAHPLEIVTLLLIPIHSGMNPQCLP